MKINIYLLVFGIIAAIIIAAAVSLFVFNKNLTSAVSLSNLHNYGRRQTYRANPDG